MMEKTLASTTEPIDSAFIARLRVDYCDTDGSFLVGLVEAFVEASYELQRATLAPVFGNQGLLMAQAAHRLKAVANMLGAHEIVTWCRQIEAAVRTGDQSTASDAMVALLQALVRSRTVLRRMANDVQPGRGK